MPARTGGVAARATGRDLVFVVGSPRSGTTWLARLMAAHPAVAASQETELVSRYCRGWYDAWRQQLPDDPETWRRHRHRGLPAVLTVEEFDAGVRDFARGVYDRTLALKPTARVVVDKTPENSLHVDVIRRLFPDAGVLHIVRDGRDVAASMLAARRGWGRDWAPGTVTAAATTWRTCVEAARAAQGAGHYLEVRYEALLADGPAVIRECLRFAGVDASAAEALEIARRFDRRTQTGETTSDSLVWAGEVVRRLGRPPEEPVGFFGAATTGGWRATWRARERVAFEAAGGGLLRSLGYEPDAAWLGVSRRRRAIAARVSRAGALARRIGWRLHVALGRRGLYVHVARIDPYD